MLLVRSSGIRRLMALVLSVCFSLFTAELAIADVHDGDAPASVEQGQPHAHAGPADASPAPRSNQPSSEHAAHVCHCVHAHGELPTSTVMLHNAPRPAAAVIPHVVQVPAAVVLEPRLRPPIA